METESPTQSTYYGSTEQPINWGRAFLCGAVASALMMAFMDIFAMMGVSDFSLETYLGSLITFRSPHSTHAWTIGLVMNWITGGVFGFVYGYFFEYVTKGATLRKGLLLGLGHAAIASVAIFPFFNTIHEEMRTNLYPSFGILGSGIGVITPFLLVFGHLLFGAIMGTFYGPVGEARALADYFEPGEHGLPGDRGVIDERVDPEDRIAS